ncbi:MAG: VWA domain-containing protein [Acidobacteriota bacterium]|nr:VWA domain-containing protein [Acidobacteriota bacterium]
MTEHQGAQNGGGLFFTSGSLCLVLILISIPTSAFAQGEVSPDDVVRVRTDLVTIPAFVTDSKGRRVAGLTRSDFIMRDNARTVALSYFATGAEHVALVFALDASGSIRDVISEQHDAALKLFSRFGHSSRVAVLHFGEKAALTLPFTADAERAEEAFSAPVQPNERTAIFDAAAAGLGAFATSVGDPSERRILILISDGLDNASATRPAAVINDARARGVSIYVIHLPLYEPRNGRLAPRPASKGFRDLAEKTGGRYFTVGDAKSALDPKATVNLEPVFKAIEDDLRGQYVLGYYPDDAARAMSQHRIEISLTPQRGRKFFVQQLRQGYDLERQNSGVRSQKPE